MFKQEERLGVRAQSRRGPAGAQPRAGGWGLVSSGRSESEIGPDPEGEDGPDHGQAQREQARRRTGSIIAVGKERGPPGETSRRSGPGTDSPPVSLSAKVDGLGWSGCPGVYIFTNGGKV